MLFSVCGLSVAARLRHFADRLRQTVTIGGVGVRVVVVDDDSFTSLLTAQVLDAAGHTTLAAATFTQAQHAVASFEPHVVVSDLNLGPGPDGADLLWDVHRASPWVGKVALTVHAAYQTALPEGHTLPPDTVYVVKHTVTSTQELLTAVQNCLNPEAGTSTPRRLSPQYTVSPAQAVTLRLIAAGYSNEGIARMRGVSRRAVEASVQRLFRTLELSPDALRNPRVAAAMLWNTGRVSIGAGTDHDVSGPDES